MVSNDRFARGIFMIVLNTAIFLVGGIIIVDMERRENIGASSEVPLPLTIVDIRNAEVKGIVDDEVVRLVEGRYEERLYQGKGGEGEPNVTMSIGVAEQAAFGDLNGDGVSDAAAILWRNLGGTGTFMSLAVFINNGGTPTYLAEANLGDRIAVNALRIERGVINLDMIVHGPQDGACCPMMPKSTSYTLVGDGLVEGWSAYKNEQHGFEVKYESGWGECLPNKRYKEGEIPLMCIERRHAETERSKTIDLVVDENSYQKSGGSYARLAASLKAEHERVLKLGIHSVFEEGSIGGMQFIRSGSEDIDAWGNYYVFLKGTLLEVRYVNAAEEAYAILGTLRVL